MRELRRWIRPLVAALLALAGEAQAARDLETDARWKEARQALDNGWFSVAALKGERLRQEQGWDEDDAKDIAGLVAEAWLRARQPDLLLKSLEREPRPHGTLYWRGEAHRMKGELEVAELVLLNYANAGRNEERARLALAQVYLAQGRDTMARRELRPLRDSADAELARRARLMFNESELALHRNEVVQGRLRDESVQDQEAHFLEARALLQEERAEEALEICRVILKGTDGGRRLHHAAQLLAVEALLQSDDAVQAGKELMLFLTTVDRTEFWGEAFDLLSRIRKAGRRPVWTEPPPELGLWVADNTHPERQGYAMFVLGDWLADQQRWQEAAALLESLVAAHPGHPAESAAIRRAMEAYGALGEDARVLELAERWRKDHGGGGEATVDFIAGTIFYQRGDATEAAERFQRSADLAGSVLERRRALYNAGAAALKAGQMALFGRLLAQLDVVGGAEAEGTAAAVAGAGSGETAGDLELDQAIQLAAQGDRQALPVVENFIAQHPAHPRLAEAQVVLAELCLLDLPPRVKAAEAALTEAQTHPNLPDEVRQRILYTQMWCREAEQDWPGVVERGKAFLEAWPEARLSAQVQMKVADAYFRQEDFANALTLFELVARDFPQSDYAEAALFFAGRSAMNLMSQEGADKAIELWEEVAAREGPLAFAARLQQAQAKRRLGKEEEAVKVVDALLAESDQPPATRWSLACEKAELLLLIGARQPEQLGAAVTWLRTFLSTEGLPYAWRARAGFLLASALRQQGDEAAAMETCYDVVTSAPPEMANPDELTWFYRAGFLAVDLLEAQRQWEGAARMAERLAATVGERATEAKDRATRIRLEHFLWEEKR